MSLGLAMGLLTVLTIAILCMPLLRPKRWGEARPSYDIGVYRDQLKELERDLERGTLSADQAQQARAEIERRLLAADTRRREGPGFRGGRKASAILMLAMPLVPAGAVAMYLSLGEPTMPDMPFAQRTDIQPGQDLAALEAVQQAILDMRARIEANADDAEAWMLLGHSLLSLERFPEASEALSTAADLTNDPYIRAEAAEAEVAAASSIVSDQALAAFEALHALDPLEPKSRFYIGLAAEQAGDPDRAVQEWIDLIALSPRNAPWLTAVQQEIGRVGQQQDLDLSKLRPSDEAMAVADGIRERIQNQTETQPLPQPTPEDIERVEAMSPEEQMAFIRSMVERLASRLEENPNDAEGWMRLAQAYEMLGEPENAASARQRAAEAREQ